MSYRILIADDDSALVKMLTTFFTIRQYTVLTASDGAEALKRVAEKPDIILLDINMPHMDGIEVCRRIRDQVSCPILFLTARVGEQDRVAGLMSGGDDYILKPFSLKELEARIAAHLRREERNRGKTDCRFEGDLVIDYASRTVQVSGHPIELTRMEYGVVEFLSMNPGFVYDKERIYERICGLDGEGDSRVVTELVRRIRNKLKAYSDQEYIETVWGTGYRWVKS